MKVGRERTKRRRKLGREMKMKGNEIELLMEKRCKKRGGGRETEVRERKKKEDKMLENGENKKEDE